MKKSQKILFFGNERLATGVTNTPLILQMLLDNYYNVCAVLLHSTLPKDESSKEASAKLAEKNNIDVVYITSKLQMVDEVTRLKPDIGVLAAFGVIIPKEVIDMIPSGILNLHPSLLPRHRGSTPIEQTIIDGDTQTGVSIMNLDVGMDTGEIFAQQAVKIPNNISKQVLADMLHTKGTAMLLETLNNLDKTTPSPQKNDGLSITKKITKPDGVIDWNEDGELIERKIRAYAGWPRSSTKLGTLDIIVNSSYHVPSKHDKPGVFEIIDDVGLLYVNTRTGALYITTLTPLGKKEMPISAFLNGYKNRL